MTVAVGELTHEGIWVSRAPRKPARRVAGLFLDRDGVLVEEVNYLHRRQDVRISPGAVELLDWAARESIPVAVVTNQAGIARGLFDWDSFLEVQDEMATRFAAQGVHVDLVVACPFHPEHTPGWNDMHAHWRKPGPGMLLQAAELLNLELGRSWMVGDGESDIAAAKAAGLAGAVHLLTGHGATFREKALALADAAFPVVPAPDLPAAIPLLQAHFAGRSAREKIR